MAARHHSSRTACSWASWSASRCRNLTSRGSERPCTRRVKSTTLNAMKTSRPRSGNASPECRVSGTARASATVATPRIPDHQRTTLSCQLIGVSSSSPERSFLESQPAGSSHSSRTSTTTAITTAASPSMLVQPAPASFRTVASSSPISPKATPVMRISTISQKALPTSR